MVKKGGKHLGLAAHWQAAFMQTISLREHAERLMNASLSADLASWTEAMTDSVMAACKAEGWTACAKRYPHAGFPVSRHEYLGMDVMVFDGKSSSWQFPISVMELENSVRDDTIAYSLWKVFCVRADLRVVFCYRKNADAGPGLVRYLEEQVVHAIEIERRHALAGDTVIVVGSRDEADRFPYGFFRWWQLDLNTARFCRL